MLKKVIYIIFLFCTPILYGQNIPHGHFLMDSIKVGEPIDFVLSYNHSRKMELIFPDSTYNFGVFELIEKKYFPTTSNDSLSFDSTVYTLRTFELRHKLKMSLPVFIIDQEDTIRRYSNIDSVVVKQLIPNPSDTLILKTDISLRSVAMKFNYPYWLSSISIFIIILVIGYFIFGKTILRNFKLYRMRKNHTDFIANYDALIEDLKINSDLASIEKVLAIWKGYLAKLEGKPINTFTSTEIITLFQVEKLKEGLQQIDRSIYGGANAVYPEGAFKVLKDFSVSRFKFHRKELLIHGI